MIRGLLVCVTLLLGVGWLSPVAAQDTDATKVYQKVLPSVVWIHSSRPNGSATGTGTLIDVNKRIILTNYHVVEDNPTARIMFPKMRDGSPIAEKKYYRERLRADGINGRIIAKDKRADLALIQLETLPKGVPAVPIAARPATPGLSVHSIGNTGKSDALWGYVPGRVRQVYEKKWRAKLDERRVIEFQARVVETDSPTNPGDSGGPLVNDVGELVGVTQGGAIDAQLVSTFVDISEVKRFVKAEGVAGSSSGSRVESQSNPKPETITAAPQPTRRSKPATVQDAAKLFQPDTLQAVQKAVDQLHAEKKLDLLVETYATAPADDLANVQQMKSADRTAYLRAWAEKRGTAEQITGVVVLVCNDPKSLFVLVTESGQPRVTAAVSKQLVDRLIAGLKANQPDAAIRDLAKLLDENAKGLR